MTKDKALYAWFGRFADSQGMKVYAATAVPKDAELPYQTYEYITGDILDGDIPITVNTWHHTESEAIPNEVAAAFKRYIRDNDLINCDEGVIWVKPGDPWVQSMRDDTDIFTKRRVFNVTLEFLTNY